MAIGMAIARGPQVLRHGRGLAVKKRAEGAAAGDADGRQGQRRERYSGTGYVRAAGPGGAGPDGARAPERARWARMACP
jgi:hypothetical protein